MRQFVIKVFNDILFGLGCGTDDIMGKNYHKFTCKLKVFLYANEISTVNAYSIL